jgi:maltose/moltooligosaccharide transporter
MIHFVCLLFGAVSFYGFDESNKINIYFAVIIGYGIAWASMMGIPYLMDAVVPRALWSLHGNY